MNENEFSGLVFRFAFAWVLHTEAMRTKQHSNFILEKFRQYEWMSAVGSIVCDPPMHIRMEAYSQWEYFNEKALLQVNCVSFCYEWITLSNVEALKLNSKHSFKDVETIE